MSKYVVKEVEGCFGVFIIDNAGIETLIETCNLESNAAVICETFNADLVKDSYGEEMLEHNKKLAEHSQSVDKALDDSCDVIRTLKHQLAEKEQAIENWKTMYESVMQTCNNDAKEIERLREQLHTANQETLYFQNKYFAEKQIAIEELEKVKDYAKSNIKNLENEEKFVQVGATIYTCKRFIKQIDGQIKLLKGEKL